MAVYDLEEQEKIDNIKAWWSQYGNRIAWSLLTVAVVFAAWRGWGWHQDRQAIEAGAVFHELQQALASNPQQARVIAGKLTEEYGGTAYAPLGALMAARASFESGDLKTARAQLRWVVEHGEAELRDIARLRLAGVMLDDKAYDEALAELAHVPVAPLVAAYAELKGDVLVAQEKPEEARTAYKAALTTLEQEAKEAESKKTDAKNEPPENAEETPRGPLVEVLRQKLDALGGEA
ncbi:MAG: tetratricopeptide repeat protein [Zoogloeaceae bacterium]|jgi:predicted negative regulator of RcsB-dependent stress response|nr:tetratricopeptide repeat protein [Zoogloeaceae bacterium]